MAIDTPNGGVNGVSDSVEIVTGSSSVGATGSVIISTGKAHSVCLDPEENPAAGGFIKFLVGIGDSGDGGMLALHAGEATADATSGGAVVFGAGEGSSTDDYDGGGHGGACQLFGGSGSGGDDADDGGSIEMVAGYARMGAGGSICARSGFGFAGSSGIIDVSTTNSGASGVSGDMDLSTGTTGLRDSDVGGDSGSITMKTTQANKGKVGRIHASVGTGNSGIGGDFVCFSGTTTDRKTGGRIAFSTGYSSRTSSGTFSLTTVNAGDDGVSGSVHFITGATSHGHSGCITTVSGASNRGSGAYLIVQRLCFAKLMKSAMQEEMWRFSSGQCGAPFVLSLCF